MNSIVSILGVGILTFASTNIDDIFVLSTFFANPRASRRAIVLGQFLGIGLLVLASVVAAMLSFVVPEGWLSLLGVVPLLIGLHKIRTLRRDSNEQPAAAEVREKRLLSQSLSVGAVTIANGGDNLGVYIPLFANSPQRIDAYALIFGAMTAVWCVLGYVFVNNPLVGAVVRRYGHFLLPFVLIALGLYILTGARVLLH